MTVSHWMQVFKVSLPNTKISESRKKIKRIREKAGISKRKLAQLAGIASTTIARIEQNQTSPRADSLERICNALNISVAYLWVSDDHDKATILHETLKSVFDDLPASAIKVMEARIRFIERKYRIKLGENYRPIYYSGGPYPVKVFDEHWINLYSREHLYLCFELGEGVTGWILDKAITPAELEDQADTPSLKSIHSWSSMRELGNFKEQGFCHNEYPFRVHYDEYCQETEESMRQLTRMPV